MSFIIQLTKTHRLLYKQEVENIVSLFLFLSLAVWEDYHTQKISNFLILSAFICAILDQFRQNRFHGIVFSLFGAGFLILILFPLYLCSALGAGDIKLLGVTSVFLSWRLTLTAFFVSIYLSLVPLIFLFFRKKKCLGTKIPMSGPILGGILLVLYKEGCF